MIFDRLSNLRNYANIPNVDAIVHFLKTNDPLKLDEGDIEIRGRDLFVKVLSYMPKPAEENKFERHKNYTDVQIIFRGIEKMQVTDETGLHPVTEYDAETDFQFFESQGNVSDIVIKDQEFLVFSPGDIHKPGCLHQALSEPVKKLVFKTKVIEN